MEIGTRFPSAQIGTEHIFDGNLLCAGDLSGRI